MITDISWLCIHIEWAILTDGCMYVLLTVFAEVFGQIYNERSGVASLNYISLAIGFTAGGQVGGRVVDYSYCKLSARQPDGKGQPEFKLPLLMVLSFVLPAGLLIYGWTAEYKTHWIGPNIGAVLFSAGCMGTFLACQSYLVDVLPLYAASVLAAAVLVRSLGGFGLPLFAPTMYEHLGQGWGQHDPGIGVGSDRHPFTICSVPVRSVFASQEQVHSG